MGPEAKITKAIRRLVERAGGWSAKLSGSDYASGIPDLVCCLPARDVHFDRNGIELRPPLTAFVEVKTPGKEASPLQAAVIAKIRKGGGTAFVAHSVEEAAAGLCLLDLVQQRRTAPKAPPEGAAAPPLNAEPTDGL